MAVTPLVSLAQAKDWLGIDSGDTRFDGRLNTMITGVSKKIGEYCGTDFQEHVISPSTPEIIDGGRQDIIVPEFLPVISVESLLLYLDIANPTVGGLDLTPGQDFVVYDYGLVLSRLNTPQVRCSVAIGYHGGYASVPEDVVQATLLAVEAFHLRKTRGTIGISSRAKSVGSGTSENEAYLNAWDLDSGLPKEAVALLQSYKFFEWPSTQSMATRNY